MALEIQLDILIGCYFISNWVLGENEQKSRLDLTGQEFFGYRFLLFYLRTHYLIIHFFKNVELYVELSMLLQKLKKNLPV